MISEVVMAQFFYCGEDSVLYHAALQEK